VNDTVGIKQQTAIMGLLPIVNPHQQAALSSGERKVSNLGYLSMSPRRGGVGLAEQDPSSAKCE